MTNWKIIGFFFAGTIFFLLLLQLQGQRLVSPVSPSGIVSLEFSHTASNTQQIVSTWKHTAKGAFHLNMLLDFLVMPFYGLFLYSLCGFFSVHYQTGVWQRLGVLFALGSLLAIATDIIENVLMIFSMHIAVTGFSSMLTAIMASIKFLLIGCAVVYIILSGIFMLAAKKEQAG